eukprot:3838519-Pyramimonas_sp.AAC.1
MAVPAGHTPQEARTKALLVDVIGIVGGCYRHWGAYLRVHRVTGHECPARTGALDVIGIGVDVIGIGVDVIGIVVDVIGIGVDVIGIGVDVIGIGTLTSESLGTNVRREPEHYML